MSIEAMRQALEVLEQINRLSIGENAISLPGEIDAAMDNLRAAIEHYDQTALELCKECGWKAIIPGDGCLVCARQKAKPVWIQRNHLEHAQREPSMCRVEPTKRLPDFVPLYTAPLQWVGLTEADRDQILIEAPAGGEYYWNDIVSISRAIEAKLKEKNDVLRSV